ncbi:MAG TPA: hypothetical protein VIC05_13280 [Solirubrobacteraceae bacterium]
MSSVRPSRPSVPVAPDRRYSTAEISRLRARRRRARRRRRLARIDMALGVALALVVIIASPGLAVTALIAFTLLVFCLVSCAVAWLRGRG